MTPERLIIVLLALLLAIYWLENRILRQALRAYRPTERERREKR